ncbi:hypothetical protein GT032_24310 [Escherichia coli]|nr:hypothetical protein [Escherichia coli]
MAITNADIHAAADRIAAEGQQPTLAAVRSALGGGSFTTISEAMKSWRAQQQAAAAPMREPAPEAVTQQAQQLAADIWAAALERANERLAHEREALEQVRAELEQQQQEAAELADQLAAELDAAKAQLEQQAQQLAQAQAQAAQAHTAQAALAEAQKRADGLADLLEKERAATRLAQDKAEKALTDAAKLAGKLEAFQAKIQAKK